MPQQYQTQSVAQAAAIPYRVSRSAGQVQVLLIRRHDGGKWGIPKGHVDPGLTAAQAAAMEALQEAGVEGSLSNRPLGSFTYAKARGGGGAGAGVQCAVRVYAMKVSAVHDDWDERHLRERRWFPIDQAAAAAGRDGVARLIRRLRDALR